MKYKVALGRDRYHLHAEIIVWCEEHIGVNRIMDRHGDAVWDLEIVFGMSTYSFKHERDAAAFALRWT